MDHKNSGLIARLWNQQKIKHSFDEICLDWSGQSKLMVLVHLFNEIYKKSALIHHPDKKHDNNDNTGTNLINTKKLIGTREAKLRIYMRLLKARNLLTQSETQHPDVSLSFFNFSLALERHYTSTIQLTY